MITTGMDGYKGQTGDSIINFTETAVDKSAFVKCVDPGSNQLNAEFYAAAMMGIVKQRMTSKLMDDVDKTHGVLQTTPTLI